jgi:proteasome lid subunit RPN8/RPN11
MLKLPLRFRQPTATTSLTRLDHQLTRLTDTCLTDLRSRVRQRAPLSRNTLDSILAIDEVRRAVSDFRSAPDGHRVELLVRQREQLIKALTHHESQAHSRAVVAKALAFLEAGIDGLVPGAAPTGVLNVVVTSSMARAWCVQLCPPERMAVVAGVSIAPRLTRATAVFDVTALDTASPVHVRADKGKMTEALISMEATGAQLVAWVHSHPGSGAVATHPSRVDRDQYADWRTDFPELTAAVVTQDRHVRFFGDAVTKGTTRISIEGPGVQRLEEHVYRLA